MTSMELAVLIILIGTAWLMGASAGLTRAAKQHSYEKDFPELSPSQRQKFCRGAYPKRKWPGLLPAIDQIWIGLLRAMDVFLYGHAERKPAMIPGLSYEETARLEKDPWILWSAEQIIAKVDAGQNIFEERTKELGKV